MTDPETAQRETTQRTSPIIVLGSALIVAATGLGVTFRSLKPLDDPDTLWHLLLGRHLLETWDFGPTDPLSPLSTQPWVYNQWVPEVVAALAERVGGLPAVAWLMVLGRMLLLFALWWVCRRHAGPAAGMFAAVVSFLATYPATAARPQLAGLILLVVAVGAAHRTMEDGRPRWWLVPFTWVWANVHGAWLFGVALLVAVAVGQLLDRRGDPARRHLARFALPLACLAVAGLTPVGPRLLLAYLHVDGIKDHIQEWQPGSRANLAFLVLLVAIVLVLLIWLRRGHRPTWSQLAIMAFTLACLVLYLRTISIGAIVLAPLLAGAVQMLVPGGWAPPRRREGAVVVAGLVLALLLAAVRLPVEASEPGGRPLGLAPHLAALPPQVVFNEHGDGGWIEWAFPHLVPVIDTRSEVFGEEYLLAFADTLDAKPGWQEWMAGSGARSALLAEDQPLAGVLRDQWGWRETARDDGYVLLQAP